MIGAGLAGLSAAMALVERGHAVTLTEAAPRAGGRCRSYFDAQLGQTIDNGNHLVLSGNRAVAAYLERIGASDRLQGPEEARFAFFERATGLRWTLRPSSGRVPWWLFSPRRRTPGTSIAAHLALASLMRGGPGDEVGAIMATHGPLWSRLAEPVLLAALNTPAAGGSARLAGRVIAESLARGGMASRPMIATPTLDAAFIDPALRFLEGHGVVPQFGRRLRGIVFDDDRATALEFGNGPEPLDGAALVLAVPSWIAADLVPGLIVPDQHSAIVNAHFALPAPTGAAPMTAVVGGLAEWIFAFEDRVSVTISAADRLVGRDRTALAAAIWDDVAATLGLTGAMPAWQIVTEKRATFAATPAQDVLRPGAATRWRNLVLAGDWTQTGLPATIEGAIRSGETAALLVQRMRNG